MSYYSYCNWRPETLANIDSDHFDEANFNLSICKYTQALIVKINIHKVLIINVKYVHMFTLAI